MRISMVGIFCCRLGTGKSPSYVTLGGRGRVEEQNDNTTRWWKSHKLWRTTYCHYDHTHIK